MTTLETTHDFFAALQRSGLLESALIDDLRKRFSGGASPVRAAKLAQLLVAERLLTSFQARQLLEARYRGFFVADKYKILDLLGEGGMGRVVLCEHLLMRRLVAVKLMHASFARNNQAVERFLREARASASLNHPNIAQVFDVDRSHRGPYLVMEYIDGTDLHRLTAKHGPLDVARSAHYIRQAAAGLQHAHEAGLVHRDVKPVNLMLDRSGTVKMLDLGLARFFDSEKNEQLTQQYDASAVLGTADFIAPEQALDSTRVDIRADIYSLGLTLYFLLTRKLPYGPGKTIQKLLWHQVREPEPLCEVRPEVPAALAAVVERMIRKDPAERYPTPAEVVAALAPFANETTALPSDVEMPSVHPSSFRLGVTIGQASPEADAGSSVPKEPADRDRRQSRVRATPRIRSGSDVRPLSSAETKSVGRTPSVAPASPSKLDDWMSEELTSGTAAPSLLPRLPQPPAAKNGARNGRTAWMIGGGIAGTVLLLVCAFALSRLGASRDEPPAKAATDAVKAAPVDVPTAIVPTSIVPTGVVLRGGGSTFVRPILDHWARIYQDKTGVNIQYTGLGSSKGIEEVLAKRLDFGCSDACLTDAQLADAGGKIVHVPLVLGAVVPTYNVSHDGASDQALRFTGPVLANIYLGKITRWNDPAIAVNNPGVRLPDLAITPVYRQDGSGTTSIWTEYLSKAGSVWKQQVGTGTTVTWPVGVGAEKNDGVADAVSRTHGALGYVELSFALANGLPAGEVKNAAGQFVAPSIDGVTAAAAGSLNSISDDLRFSLTDAPGSASFPICGASWAVLHVDQSSGKGAEIAKFLRWATTEGQQYVGDLRYGRLPAELSPAVLRAIESIQTK